MFTAITHTQIWVLDQDEALDFYVGKLGLEVAADADLGFMRWLTLRVPGDPDRELLLEVPGPPAHDPQTVEEVRKLLAQGALGVVAIFRTPDCRRTYEDLLAKGVEFTQAPVERFYGTDCGLRDPFGNHIRFTEPTPVVEIPPPDSEEITQLFERTEPA